MGDAFPDFDKMTLEEQMAWLESLAKRQGVKDEELTTKADLDIPIPEDAHVDEPGYVPFEGSASARKLKEAQEAAARAEPEPEPEPEFEPEAEFEPEPEIVAEPEFQAEPEPDFLADEELVEESLWEIAEPIEEVELFAESGDAADPMLWLDSLSAQPEGELEDLFADTEAFALEGGEETLELEASELSAVSDELDMAESAASSDDPLGGMDPMVWLESLAKRQGANPDELVTSANLEVAEVDGATVIDEPGYVPFEGSASARRLKEAQEFEFGLDTAPAEPEIGFEQPEAEEPMEQQEAATYQEEGAAVEDSMLWLESLAKRQGANPEELLTEADLDIPELPEDTVIDEPGYVEYSPFSILPDQDIELPEAEQADQGAADAALSWLEDLVAEPGEDLSEILAFGEEMFEPVEEEAAPEQPAPTAKPGRDDPLAGMTDEEVAYAQAHGQLTGEQELAWLKRQAAKLAEVRESQEAESELLAEEEQEIVPGELPPWLLEMRDEVEPLDLEASEQPIEEVTLAEEQVDFSDWFEETPAAEGEAGLEIPGFDAAVLAEEDVNSLWGETPDTEIELEDIGLPDDSELAKFLAEGIVPEGADPLAEALDAEFDRKLTGDETEPEWYTDAVAKVAGDVSFMPESDIEQAVEQPVEGVVEASLVDMPDWLKEAGEEIILADDVAMPGWLMEAGEIESAAEAEEPAWLAEPELEFAPADEEELPSWLLDLDKTPEEAVVFAEDIVQPIEVEAVEPVVEPEPEPQAVIPEPRAPVLGIPPEPEIRRPAVVQPEVRGELLQKITQRLQQDPNDHATRLAFARALRDNQQTSPSLDQYEALIDTSQLLQDVSDDLVSLTEAHGNVPRVRRLLGDAFMRRGMLQEALSAYRGALEQL